MDILGMIYEGGGAKPQSWPRVGTVVEGVVLSVRSKQCDDFTTKRPETWPDGSPKMTPIVTLQTNLQEDAEDDGRRDIYLRTGAFTAFRDAMKEAYKTKPTHDDLIGATLKIGFVKEAPGRGNNRKVFKARITPKPAASVELGWEDDDDLPPEPGEPLTTGNAPEDVRF